MTGRRAPLANVANAINSPYRAHVNNTGKRSRTQAGELQDKTPGQPPAKKQLLELVHHETENMDPARRGGLVVTTHGNNDEPFSRRLAGTQPTALTRKLAASREKKVVPPQRTEASQQKADGDGLESVRQWKRHYLRQFPRFSFYFESVPEDLRTKLTRQFQSLGAKEEKFFSHSVTHVITTRPIPPELAHTSPDEAPNVPVERVNSHTAPVFLTADQRKTTSLLDANLQRRGQTQVRDVGNDTDPRKPHCNTADILSRARTLGIKIWALEKLQRVLRTMLTTDMDESTTSLDTQSQVAGGRSVLRTAQNADLELLLRNEKVYGPADRDMAVAAYDMVGFKGCYLYIHDMDERTKPALMRDYPKPAPKDQGSWPQFRITPLGRCPFVEDPSHVKKVLQDDREAQAQRTFAIQRETSALRAAGEGSLRRSPRKAMAATQPDLAKPLDPPTQIPAKRQSSASGVSALFGSAQQNMRGLPRTVAGEPVASGLQQSNMTSAIRSAAVSSAAVSSTAAGVNKRVGDSKEVSVLKRKVLERGASIPSHPSAPSSYVNDMRAAINEEKGPPPRAAKRKAQETLGVLHEDGEDTHDAVRPTHRRAAPRKRKPAAKEAKPGYCENCRDKFEDFDDVSVFIFFAVVVGRLFADFLRQHVVSRKHRKFATSLENWRELDDLLRMLKRPHKSPTE